VWEAREAVSGGLKREGEGRQPAAQPNASSFAVILKSSINSLSSLASHRL